MKSRISEQVKDESAIRISGGQQTLHFAVVYVVMLCLVWAASRDGAVKVEEEDPRAPWQNTRLSGTPTPKPQNALTLT